MFALWEHLYMLSSEPDSPGLLEVSIPLPDLKHALHTYKLVGIMP